MPDKDAKRLRNEQKLEALIGNLLIETLRHPEISLIDIRCETLQRHINEIQSDRKKTGWWFLFCILWCIGYLILDYQDPVSVAVSATTLSVSVAVYFILRWHYHRLIRSYTEELDRLNRVDRLI